MNRSATPIEIARAVMKTLHDNLAGEPACAFMIVDNDCIVTGIGPDPYRLMDTIPNVHDSGDVQVIGISSYGWAAPYLDRDGDVVEPSRSPDRRRVHLVCVTTLDGATANLFTFLDTGEIVTDELGEATGSLADALRVMASWVSSDGQPPSA